MMAPNLPDLRKRILAGEEIPLEELRAAVEFQIHIRKVVFEKEKVAKAPKPPAEPKTPRATSSKRKPKTPTVPASDVSDLL